MCGICGVVQIGGSARPVLEPGAIDRMTDAMTHRGPNDRGIFSDDGIAIGARRLSIIDVDGGHQPFSNEDGTVWGAQNGELYNHDELRSMLVRDGHRLASRCDTEIIPHLYEREGPGFAGSLWGKFAIVVWDGVQRRAVLARDRLGVKPLYYARRGDLVAFASELKSLLASGLIEPELDYEAIGAYLQLGFMPGPRTPLAGVNKVMPGHSVVIDAAGVREECYWEFPKPAPDETMSEAEAGERLLAELESAVRRRLMSDVPLGAMLSGGLDSSLIVALMARNMSEPVKTFSVGFAESGRDNELADAKLVASAMGTDHHALELSLSEQQVGLEELAWWLDEPLADLSALGFLSLSELASSHVTVALSGQGADELLGGYPRYRRAAVVGHFKRMPAPLRAAAIAGLARGNARYARFSSAIAAPDPATRYLALRTPWLDSELLAQLATGELADTVGGGAAARAIATHAEGLVDDPLSASMHLDSHLGLVDDMIHYFDRASMAHSLEVRVPFLDHNVVEFAATIPGHLKVHRLTTKYVLKQVSRGLVPDSIIDKRKIGFFNGVSHQWMRSQLQGPAFDYLMDDQLACGAFLDQAQIRQMARRHAQGAATDLSALYAVLMLEVWLKSVLPRALGAESPQRELIRVSS